MAKRKKKKEKKKKEKKQNKKKQVFSWRSSYKKDIEEEKMWSLTAVLAPMDVEQILQAGLPIVLTIIIKINNK